jgi:hypothetical protein
MGCLPSQPPLPMRVVWMRSAALALRRASRPWSEMSPWLGWASVMRMMRFSVSAGLAAMQALQRFISAVAAEGQTGQDTHSTEG